MMSRNTFPELQPDSALYAQSENLNLNQIKILNLAHVPQKLPITFTMGDSSNLFVPQYYIPTTTTFQTTLMPVH